MRLLLDTHAFVWWVADDDRLSPRARHLVANSRNEVLFGVVSAWEIVVKETLGRSRPSEPAHDLLPHVLRAHGSGVLPLRLGHALGVASLPDHLRDPFDRLLVA